MLGSTKVQLQLPLAIRGLESLLYKSHRLPGCPQHWHRSSRQLQDWMAPDKDDVQGQRLADFQVPHWEWHNNPKEPEDVPAAIVTTIRSKDHFWHFWDELLSDVCQLPNKVIHALNTCITTLVSQCKVPHLETQEMLKLMVLQHAMWYHKTKDCIWLQD